MPKPSGTNHPKLVRSLVERKRNLRGGRNPSAPLVNPYAANRAAKRYCGDDSAGAHLFPFRTEKLRPAAPMVLPEEGGRVGRRPMPQASPKQGGFFCASPVNILLKFSFSPFLLNCRFSTPFCLYLYPQKKCSFVL